MCFYITFGNQTWQLTIPIKHESFPAENMGRSARDGVTGWVFPLKHYLQMIYPFTHYQLWIFRAKFDYQRPQPGYPSVAPRTDRAAHGEIGLPRPQRSRHGN
jgi:hypothetical protein